MKDIKPFFLIMGCVLAAASLDARVRRDDSYSLQNSLQDLRYEFNNHEEEIRMLGEKLEYQDAEMANLRLMLQEATKANKAAVQGNLSHLEKRVKSLESSLQNTSADLKKLQTHANDTAKSLHDFQGRLSDLEGRMDHIQTAMESIFKALNVDVSLPKTNYTVQPGDTLGGIAHKNHTTIKAIKERNQLKNSTIYPGQKLDIPQGK